MSDSRIPTLHLKIFRGDELLEERAFVDEPSISIGRSDGAVLRIDDDGLGELHAVLNVEDDGSVQLLDLGTEAGTRHNGEPIANATLSSGDTFELGPIRVQIRFDEVEGTTPTVDFRPGDEAPPEVAAVLAEEAEEAIPVSDGQDDEAPGEVVEEEVAAASTEAAPAPYVPEPEEPLSERVEDIMELVLRSGRGAGTAGIDVKAPKVLEVSQIWENILLDSKHFKQGGEVTIGDAVGFQWSLIGVPLGWLPRTTPEVLKTALRLSPPIWSDVRSDWRDDFYASDEALPKGEEFKLFTSEGKSYVAHIYEKWTATADIGEERFTLDQLVEAGKARRDGNTVHVPITEDIRLLVDIGGVVFVGQLVHPGAKVVAALADSIDYPFLGIFLFCAFLGLVFGGIMAFSPPPPDNDLIEVPDRFVELLLEKPDLDKDKKDNKPDANPDAGEGAKAKKEEGKVGKKDAKMEKAKGNKKEVAQTERDREIAENAGVLGALNDAGGMDGVFGSSGLDASLTGGIGGLIGAKGVQIGAGGLGSRGSGLGGGGTAEGLGGLGTKGIGSGSSGFGSGGGSFGAKGSGGISAVSGDPIILGALDRSLIDAVIKRKMSQIRYCYQRELQKDPTLNGKLVIGFTIAKDGTVSKANAKTSTMNNVAVDKCVVDRFYKMQFPEPKGGGIVVVSYPFIFSPG